MTIIAIKKFEILLCVCVSTYLEMAGCSRCWCLVLNVDI